MESICYGAIFLVATIAVFIIFYHLLLRKDFNDYDLLNNMTEWITFPDLLKKVNSSKSGNISLIKFAKSLERLEATGIIIGRDIKDQKILQEKKVGKEFIWSRYLNSD